MAEWQPIQTAPKDGSTVAVRRIYDGQVIYEGPAAWRTVRFVASFDPRSGEQVADQHGLVRLIPTSPAVPSPAQ